MKLNKRRVCETCATKSPSYFLDEGALPVWYLEGVPQYQLPKELQDLSHAEKMLIQRVSPFVPLHHIKLGTWGLSGHVCAFEQDLEGFCSRLPRQKDDVTMLKVLQSVRAEIGNVDNQACIKAFRVRKQKIMKALQFLQEYNPLYHDIVIDESALDWILGDEGVLTGGEMTVDDMATAADNTHQNSDMGPAASQTVDPARMGDNVAAFGFTPTSGKSVLSEEDAKSNKVLRDAVSKSPNQKEIVVDWPDISDQPVNEYGDKKIFALAFPWLFPGGIGDVKDHPSSISLWGKQMLFYEDGRFARDKIFCFFAMNYIVRRRNQSSGKFFVDHFQRNCPDTLDELKEAIKDGDTSFVNSLTYYNKRIKGSAPYWLQKRSEVYTWINHHVEAGHGAPTYFITLSCAEYFWADVIDLLRDRLVIAKIDPNDCKVGSPKLVQIANDYAVVIQEYFQLRVETWLETVGKNIFDISHYWVRYEFAPGRGQIHAHLLAIPNDQSVYESCYTAMQTKDGVNMRARLLSEWAQKQFGLTASVGEKFDERVITWENSPVQFRFKDLNANDVSHYEDQQNLMKSVQVHQCSEFCLQTRKNNGYVPDGLKYYVLISNRRNRSFYLCYSNQPSDQQKPCLQSRLWPGTRCWQVQYTGLPVDRQPRGEVRPQAKPETLFATEPWFFKPDID